jgi:hypothetical protein
MDGGVRSGVDVDGVTVANHFEAGEKQNDPALAWFVDLRCEGDGVPDRLEAIREWLLRYAAVVTAGFRGLAAKLEVGIDQDVWPLEWMVPNAPTNTCITLVCSCIRRFSARKMKDVVQDLETRWQEYLRQLEPVEASL